MYTSYSGTLYPSHIVFQPTDTSSSTKGPGGESFHGGYSSQVNMSGPLHISLHRRNEATLKKSSNTTG